jgi:cellobiose phosphorylase
LGLHREQGELRIDPCIPPAWPGFEAWVHVGAKKVHVIVENPDGVSKGVAAITVNGLELSSNRIGSGALAREGTHEVRVRLGSVHVTARGASVPVAVAQGFDRPAGQAH